MIKNQVDQAEYLRLWAKQMTEEELQNNVIQLGKALGWRVYHTWNSLNSEPGYPDLTMFHAGQHRILWAELKRENIKAIQAQVDFGALIQASGGEFYLWRPSMWFSSEIERILRE